MEQSQLITIVVEDSSYYPGSLLSGKLIIQTDQPKRYDFISIDFTGAAETHWTDGLESCRHRNSHHKHHHAGKGSCHLVERKNTESYISKTHTLWKKELSYGYFPQGIRNFPFQFTIPSNVPPSFEGANGWIRYKLVAQIHPTGGTSKSYHFATTTIPVHLPPETTNQHSLSLSLPQAYENKKKFVFLNSRSLGKVVLAVDMDKTSGFKLGEEIPLRFYIENDTRYRVQLVASITREEEYKFRGPYHSTGSALTRKVTNELALFSSNHIHIGQVGVFNMGSWMTPRNMQCSLGPCACISLRFLLNLTLKVEASAAKIHSASTNIPIVYTYTPQATTNTAAATSHSTQLASRGSSPELQPASPSHINNDSHEPTPTKLRFSIPKAYENGKSPVYLTCRPGKVTISLEMPQNTVFNVSENLPLCVKISNYSSTDVMLSASISKHTPNTSRGRSAAAQRGYNSTSVSHETDCVFSDVIHQSAWPRHSITWSDKLFIPKHILPKREAAVTESDTKYFLKFKLHELGSRVNHHGDVSMSLPVTLEPIDGVMSGDDPDSQSYSNQNPPNLTPTQASPVHHGVSENDSHLVTSNPTTQQSANGTTNRTHAITLDSIAETMSFPSVVSPPEYSPAAATSTSSSSETSDKTGNKLTTEPPPSYEEAIKFLSFYRTYAS